MTLTLESGSEVVIVEDESVATRADADDLDARLSEAFTKYKASGYSPGPDSWSGEDGGGLRVITPHRAMAWFSFPRTARASPSDAKTLLHPTPARRTTTRPYAGPRRAWDPRPSPREPVTAAAR